MPRRLIPGCEPAPLRGIRLYMHCGACPAISRLPIPSADQPSPLTLTLTLHPGSPRHTRTRASPLAGSCDALKGGWLRPQAEAALRHAAKCGDLATLKRLVAEGVNLEAKEPQVSATPPAAPPAPSAPRPPPSPPAAPAAPALAAAAHRVWRRRRTSAGLGHGPHECGLHRQPRLPRAPRRQRRQAECPELGAPQPCCAVVARGVGG